jgi:hypothetical protein
MNGTLTLALEELGQRIRLRAFSSDSTDQSLQAKFQDVERMTR